MNSDDPVIIEKKALIVIVSCISLTMNLICFFTLFFNDSRKQDKSLIPKLIILGCVFQSIISYCCITSTNTSDFFYFNPLPEIFDQLYIFKKIPENLINLMKFWNGTIFIIALIACYLNEIFYCIETIYLFQNPISNTKYRRILYIFFEFTLSIFLAGIALKHIFDDIKYFKNITDILDKDDDIINDKTIDECKINNLKFIVHLSICSEIAFSHDDKYFGIIIQSIRHPLNIICIIYILIALISIFAILNSIKTQTKLFIYGKKIFRTRHILYSILGICLTLAFQIPIYLIEDNDKKFINEKVEDYPQICFAMTMALNLFGLSNSIFRLLEINFFQQFNIKGNFINEGYNEKAINQFLILINDQEEENKLLKKINKINKSKRQKDDIIKFLENKELNEEIIGATLSPSPKRKQNLKNKFSLSAQIACDFLSEAVYYIVSCITYSAINNKSVTYIIEDDSYIRCNEHILKLNETTKFIDNSKINKIYIPIEDNVNNNLNNNKNEKEEKFIMNTSFLDSSNENISTDSIGNDIIETKENYKTTNEWETRRIDLKQVKLGNFCINFFSKKIRIIEYAPEIFKNILRFDNIDEKQIIKSFNVTDNILKLSNFKGSEGKSGSIFFETHDKKFIIKTIREDELYSMLFSLIKPYYTLFSNNSYSNLNRIYGIYTLILGLSKVHVIVIENFFPFDKKSLICKFDLKGSKMGRITKKIFDKEGKTLKDNDYIELSNKDLRYKIDLNNKSKKYIKNVISFDLNILEEARLMDYSFFVCLAKKDLIDKERNRIINKDRIFESKDKNYVYIFGIIDYLTQYGTKKKIEFFIKSCCKKKNAMSSVNPIKYRKRFTGFLKKLSIL